MLLQRSKKFLSSSNNGHIKFLISILRYGFVIYSPEHSNIRYAMWCDPIQIWCDAMLRLWLFCLDYFRVDGQNLRQSLRERQWKMVDSFSRLMFSTVRFHATFTWAAIVNWTIVEKILIQGMSKKRCNRLPEIYLQIERYLIYEM